MTNAQIIEICKNAYCVLENLPINAEDFKTKDLFCDCHNHSHSLIDSALWGIAEDLGYEGNYDEFINEMIPRFPGTSNPL